MFDKNEFIVSSSFGICKVEKVTKLVVGREKQMEYYVLQSPADKKKKSYIPVSHHETVLRKPMTEEDAKNILEKMVIYGKEIKGETNYTLKEGRQVLETGDPEKWGLFASFYLKKNLEMDQEKREVFGKIWENLQGELAFVLKKNLEDIRQMAENGVK